MKCKNAYKELLIIIISLFTTIAIAINPSKDTKLLSFINGNSFVWIIVVFFIYQLVKEVLKVNNKRLIVCSIILGILFASFCVIGNSINNYMDLSGIIFSNTTVIKSIMKWLGYVVLISSTIIVLYDKINNIIEKYKSKESVNKEGSKILNYFTANKRSFFICWGLIFIAWIPYLLTYYPGIVTPDSADQIRQALGISTINAHHPLLHTIIIRLAMLIGNVIKGQNTGVLIYSIIQMLAMSAIFSFGIYYMAKKEIPICIRIVSLLFWAFYPVNAMYSITMWKNILSGGAILLFIICMTELATNHYGFLKSKFKCFALVFISLLIIYLLNNGIYIILLTAPFVVLTCKKNYKKTILLFITIFVINTIISTLLFSVLNIQKGSIREALSIPLQQFARVTKYRGNELTEEEKQIIYNFLPVENLGDLYNPTLSDPVKANFSNSYFEDNKLEFITTWIKLFFKYPLEYVESFLCNCYGYWYPEATNWVVSRVITEDEMLEIKSEPKINGKLVTSIDSLVDRRDIPVVSMMFSLGFLFWLVLTSLMYVIYRKNYNLILVYIPILILWLTCLASPVFCEFRYLYGMITSLPILLSIPTLIEVKNKEEKNG